MRIPDISNGVLLTLLTLVVISSGCIQSSKTNLNSNFDLDYKEADLNKSGYALYKQSLSQINSTSAYDAEAENKMALNLPVVNLEINTSSKADFGDNKSTINTSGVVGVNFGGEGNSTEFSTRLVTEGNKTKIGRTTNGTMNWTTNPKYSRDKMGVSMKSIFNIDVNNASLLGKTQEQELILKLKTNSSSLMQHFSTIIEALAVKEGPMEKAENVGKMEESKSYLWIDQEDKMPSRLAYYGSANNGSLQVRSEIDFENASKK